MSSLTGSTISSTYQSLLKIDGNNTLSATLRNITDGVGNITPISMSTTLLNISTAFKLSSYGTGARTGTATYNLAVDATGNVIEVLGGGGGGTTINPTDDYIPVRSNATTFVDSLLFSTTTILKSVFSGFDRGLYFDYLNNLFFYGTTSSGMTYVNNANQEVSLLSNSQIYANLDGVNNVGYFGGAGARLNFDGNSNKCNIGDGNGNFNGTYVEVDDLIGLIKTNPTGLKLDIANREYYLGDFNNISNGTSIKIDDFGKTIAIFQGGNDNGLVVNLQSFRFSFGDYINSNNNTYLYIDDTAKLIQLYTNGGQVDTNADLLTFNGALTSSSAGGNSGQHLKVTINGNPYKINLLNP
jgi:hypothetical protein